MQIAVEDAWRQQSFIYGYIKSLRLDPWVCRHARGYREFTCLLRGQIFKQQHGPIFGCECGGFFIYGFAVQSRADQNLFRSVAACVPPFIFGAQSQRDLFTATHNARTGPLQLRRSTRHDLNHNIFTDSSKTRCAEWIDIATNLEILFDKRLHACARTAEAAIA